MMTQLAKLDALKEKLDSYRPLDQQVVNKSTQSRDIATAKKLAKEWSNPND